MEVTKVIKTKNAETTSKNALKTVGAFQGLLYFVQAGQMSKYKEELLNAILKDLRRVATYESQDTKFLTKAPPVPPAKSPARSTVNMGTRQAESNTITWVEKSPLQMESTTRVIPSHECQKTSMMTRMVVNTPFGMMVNQFRP